MEDDIDACNHYRGCPFFLRSEGYLCVRRGCQCQVCAGKAINPSDIFCTAIAYPEPAVIQDQVSGLAHQFVIKFLSEACI